jgi:hypothetical protein
MRSESPSRAREIGVRHTLTHLAHVVYWLPHVPRSETYHVARPALLSGRTNERDRIYVHDLRHTFKLPSGHSAKDVRLTYSLRLSLDGAPIMQICRAG